MAGLIQELQSDALNHLASVSDLLRKALVVSKKLKITDIEDWINSELNGYKDMKNIPSYRIVHGEVKVKNPYRGMQPLNFENAELAEIFQTSRNAQPIRELESIIVDASGFIYSPFSEAQKSFLYKNMTIALEPLLIISKASIIGILDAVRNKILDWSLELESNGILGDGMSFTIEEVKAAGSVNYQITNNIGSMNNSQLQQHSNDSPQTLNNQLDIAKLTDLVAHLKSAVNQLSINENDLKEYEAELKTIDSQMSSPKPKISILHESLKSLRSILEGATGSVLATELSLKISTIIQLLPFH